jgi:hypothetical protein
VAVVDEEQVRAAVTVALDASMESMVEEIARRVVAALQTAKPAAVSSAPAPAADNMPQPAAPPPPEAQPVRRVSSLRTRSTSILGLDK